MSNEFTPRKGLKLPDQTASRALTTDANSKVTSSSVTSAELGYLSGVTSAIQTQLNTNSTGLSDHLSDTFDAHDASAISNVPAGNLSASTVQAALDELQTDIDTRATSSSLTDHLNDTTDAHDASAISNVASGNLAATDVQAALNELQTDVDTRQLRSTLTTKGDIYVATASNTVTRLPVGTNGYTLQADSAQAEGIKWAAPAAVAIGDSITSATAGSIFFAGAAGVLAQDNANLFYDDTNNRLGVGTSSPQEKIHSSGVIRSDGGLKVNGSPSGYHAELLFTDTTATGENAIATSSTGSPIMYFDHRATSNTGEFRWRVGTGGGTERMRLDTSGNLGLNGAAPSTARISINGAGTAAPATSGTTQSAGHIARLAGSNNAIIDIGSNSSTYLWLQGTDKTSLAATYPIYINPVGGNVVIGTTSTSTLVNASAASSGFEYLPGNYLGLTNSTGGNYNLILNKSGSVTGTVAGFRYNGSDVGTISINTTNTAYNTSSDGRLKTNFTPLEGLSKVMQLEPVKYDWTHQPGATGTGFVAQDLHQIIPEAVTVGDLDETKRFGDEGFKSWGVDYSKVVPYLVKALQELKTEFDAYKETHP